MITTRRTFLRAGAASAAFAALNLGPSQLLLAQTTAGGEDYYPIPYEAKTSPVFYFNKDTFTPYVGTDFTVEGGRLLLVKTIRLVKITDWHAEMIARRVKPHGGECFSLHFQGGSTAPAEPRTYWLSHGALGKFQLFLVGRAGTTRAGANYEAVINHIP
jgi:hypothetical protein